MELVVKDGQITSQTKVCYASPSRICAVCDALEIPGAEIASGGFWICPECKAKLKRLIDKEEA